MKQNKMHKQSVTTFKDILRHQELEVERSEVAKGESSSYVAKVGSHNTFGSKRKRSEKIMRLKLRLVTLALTSTSGTNEH